MHTLKHQRGNKFASNAVVFGAFLLTAQLGAYLYREVGTAPAMIWAPVGIAIAAIILEGPSILPSIALATLVNGLLIGTPAMVIAGAVLGNTLQPAAAFYFLKYTGFQRKLARVKDMFLMLAVSLFITMIVPTINTLAINYYNRLYIDDQPAFWINWWVGGALSALILAPFLIRWLRYPVGRQTRSKWVEITIAILALCAVSYFLFATPYVTLGGFSLIYPLLGILLWMVFRTNSRIMTLGLFLMTAISMIGALYGTYVPTASGLSGRIFSTQIFDLIFAVVFFILVSVEEQRKQAVMAIRGKNKQLEAALEKIHQEDSAKSKFIAILAHELRNPLAAFLSSVELLLVGDPSEDPSETKRLAEMMRRRVKVMGRLLDDLLDVSRIGRGQLELKKEEVSLKRVVEEAVQDATPLLKERRHSFGVSLPEEEVILTADPVRLGQIFINLLTNAAKYTPPGGQIGLKGEYKDGWILLSVTDTGVGIPADMLTRIFDPFVQVNNEFRAASGVGIGLALTKSLVEMHNGAISVKSSDQGSEFTIKLPATLIAPSPIPVPVPQKKTSEGFKNRDGRATFHILVVDDNLAAAQGLGKLLALRGHRTDVVHDGQSALDKVQELLPDIVLLDIGLPDMSGYEVAQKIKGTGNASVLIAITGYGQAEDVQKAKQAGFDHHLTKPVGLADIEAVLARIVPK